jgi:formate hydrogenlyase subunit 4
VVSVLLPALAQILHLALMLAAAALLAGAVAWFEARMQGRAGPSLLQPWRDAARALGQMPVVGEGISPVGRAAPAARLAVLLVAAALVPSFTPHMTLAPAADLLVIAGLLGLARALAVLGAMDSGTAAGGPAAAATLARATLAAPALLGVVFAFALAAGDTALPAVLEVPFDEAPGLLPALLPLGLALLLAMAADGDGGVGERSGRHLALDAAADALRRLVWLALLAALVLPPGLPPPRPDPATTIGDWLIFLPVWAAKLALLAAGIALLRTLVPAPRAGQVPALMALAALLAALGVGVLFAGQALRGAA